MSRIRRIIGAASFTALALLGDVAVAAPTAAAGVGGVHHYTHADVVAAHDAINTAKYACNFALVAEGVLMNIAACSGGINDVQDGLNEAYLRGCGMDLYWTDEGPLSYDGTYRAVACP